MSAEVAVVMEDFQGVEVFGEGVVKEGAAFEEVLVVVVPAVGAGGRVEGFEVGVVGGEVEGGEVVADADAVADPSL